MLTVNNLSAYLGKYKAIDNIGFDLKAGELVGLLGPNGAGKSTLLRAIAGLIKCDGAITLNGHDNKTLSNAARAKELAYLPQQREIHWPLSVETVVRLGRLPHQSQSKMSDQDHAICKQAMQQTGVYELRQRSMTTLSGGEQARALAARALAQDAGLLLADEPVAGLDPAHQISLMQALQNYAHQGRIVMVSLHDIGLAARGCDRILVLKNGQLHDDGAPQDIITKQLLLDVYDITAHVERAETGLIVAPLGLGDKNDV